MPGPKTGADAGAILLPRLTGPVLFHVGAVVTRRQH